MEQVLVRPGQIWADNAKRYKDAGERQHLIVKDVFSDRAILVNEARTPRYRESTVSTSDLNSRFTLIEDVEGWPEGTSRVQILESELAQLGIVNDWDYDGMSVDFEQLLMYIDERVDAQER